MNCPDGFDVAWARDFIAYLGGDASIVKDNWCWSRFGEHFQHLREKAEQFFAAAATGDPPSAAYGMCKYCGSTREWAEGVIERAATGDPAWAAYLMCSYCGSTREWAEGVIERAATGNPPWAAYSMCSSRGSTREWAEGVRNQHGP